MTDQQWDAGIELKLHGARRLTLRAWEALKTTKGAVVLIVGNAAEIPTASAAAAGVVTLRSSDRRSPLPIADWQMGLRSTVYRPERS